MKTLLAITLLVLCSFQSEHKAGCAKIDIILIADMSGSINGQQQYVHDALYQFADRFELEENGIRMSLIKFNDDATVLYPLGNDKAELMQAIETIKTTYPEGTTKMTTAFIATMNEFIKRGGRDDPLRVVILISDGAPTDDEQSKQMAKDLRETFNSLIFGILVSSYEQDEQFMREVSSLNCYLETGYGSLANELKKLDICI